MSGVSVGYLRRRRRCSTVFVEQALMETPDVVKVDHQVTGRI